MRTRLSRVLACLFAGILTATAADYSVFAAQTSTLEYYVCPNSKILKEDETDYSEMSKGGTLRFSAAANERESGQIILTGSGTQTITLSLAGDLSDGRGNSIGTENFEIFFEHYVYVTPSWNLTDKGSYPDALIPDKLATDIGANRISFGSTKTYQYNNSNDNAINCNVKKINQGVWFTVNVPAGTPAGIYTGKLTGSLEVNVEIQVFDFELPDKTQSATHFAVWPKGWGPAGLDSDESYYSKISEVLDERKISSGSVCSNTKYITTSNLDTYVNNVFNYVQNRKSPYYDITMGYCSSEPPIELRDITIFWDALSKGWKEYKEYYQKDVNQDNSNIDMIAAEHIDDVAWTLTNILEEFAGSHLGENNSILNEENNNLRTVVKHFYKDYLIEYGQNDSLPEYEKFGPYCYKLNADLNPAQLNSKYRCVDYEAYQNSVRSLLTAQMKGCHDENGMIILPYYYYLYTPLKVISQFDRNDYGNIVLGVETIMKTIVDKSMEEKLDLLQYAYLYIPQVDEPKEWLLTPNIETLVNRYIFEQCKINVKDYITKYQDNNQVEQKQIKNSLLQSLDDMMFLFTTTPTDNEKRQHPSLGNREVTVFTPIQYKGLDYLNGITDADKLKKLMTSEKYENDKLRITIPHVSKEGNESLGTGESTSSRDIEWGAYSYQLPQSYSSKDFCPLFNEFSSEPLAYAQDVDTTIAALNNPEIRMWWYSCQSNSNASLAGFPLNQNRGLLDFNGNTNYMDPLTVKRANKWQQFQMGFRGELYYAVDAKNEQLDRIGLDGHEARLIYPIKQFIINVSGITDERVLNQKAKNYGYFMSTLRLENEAEANDDYDYLSLAEQLVESKPDHPEYRDRLNSIIQMVIEPGNVEYTDPELTNSANLTRARSLLAAFIEGRFGNIKEVTNDGINNTFTSIADGVPVIKDWHNRNIVLCFDVCETNTYRKSKSERTTKISLVTSEWQRLNQHITIDFETKTIMDCVGAGLVPKGAGWYTVQIPLKNVDLNLDPNEPKGPAKGDETLSMVFFDQRYVNQSFLVDNFRVLKEVTTDGINNTFTSATDGVPVIKDWHNKNTVLCFDVCETNTYQKSKSERTAKISLVTSEWQRLNQHVTIDFESKTIMDCAGAALVPKGTGWYTVQIPLKNVDLNVDPNEAKGPAKGDETLSMVFFDQRYVNQSFLVDNFRVLKEVTTDGINNTFTSTKDGVPVIDKWKYSNLALCFDVCETNTYQKSRSDRTAKISLATSEWQRLNQHVTIDFESKTIMDCAGAALVPKGTGWYTVQIPLKNVDLNLDPNEAKGPANGKETLSMVFFDQRYVNQSFLVDNFRLETAVGNGDLNGDGKPDKKDVTEFGDYIMKNGAPPQNAWEADLDHNGVHDARDMSRLKQMLLAQQ